MLHKLQLLLLFTAIAFISVDSTVLFAQQKEMTIDISSHQRPDTTYAKPKSANVVAEENATTSTTEVVAAQAANPEILLMIDSLRKEVNQLRSQATANRDVIAGIQTNLSTSHKKFKLGTLLLLGGYLAYNLGVISLNNTPSTAQIGPETTLLILGGLGSTVTGLVILIRSHRYIGKAGKVTSYKNGAYYR